MKGYVNSSRYYVDAVANFHIALPQKDYNLSQSHKTNLESCLGSIFPKRASSISQICSIFSLFAQMLWSFVSSSVPYFFLITSYIQVRWEYTGRKQKKTFFFETDCFIQTGGREDKGYSADLVVHWDEGVENASENVLMLTLIFCQEINLTFILEDLTAGECLEWTCGGNLSIWFNIYIP